MFKLLNEVDPYYRSGNTIPAERAFIPIDVWTRFRALVESLRLEEETQQVRSEKRPIDAIKFPEKRVMDGDEQADQDGYSEGWNDALKRIRDINTRRLWAHKSTFLTQKECINHPIRSLPHRSWPLLANPSFGEQERQRLVNTLMDARRALEIAKASGVGAALAAARRAVDSAKVGLGERGQVWWTDGAPDCNRHLVKNAPYAEWFDVASPGVADS